MDFFKSVLPPLPKLPKLKKFRQWNGGSLLSLNQFPNLPAAFSLGNSGVTPASSTSSASTARPNPRSDFVRQHPAPPRQQHMRHSSDISIISAAVSSRTPADYSHRDNLGLYALKCDRSAAKRGILLNLPRKITQAVGGSETPIGPTPATMVHEKFSPCKRRPVEVAEIKPPPRRRKRPPACDRQTKGPDADLSRWQKNSSELFRIVERESASTARASSAGGVGLMLAKKPHRAGVPAPLPKGSAPFYDAPTSSSDGAVVELVEQIKAQSVDNLLAMRYHRRRRGAFAEPERPREESDSESSDNRQVQSLRLHQQPPQHQPHQPHRHHRRTSSAVNGTVTERISQTAKAAPPSGSTSLPSTVPARHFPPMDRACDFSIDNNSDEIEVRFRKGYSTDESSETTITVAGAKQDDAERRPPNTEKLPLPPRVVQLRRTDSGPSCRAKLTSSPVRTVPKLPEPEPPVAQPDPTTARQFLPLAEVLRKSIDSAELKRKWINDFLAQGSETSGPEGPPVAKVSTALEPFVPQLDIVQRMDRQLEELEGSVTTHRQGSNGSVDIFRQTNSDFDEFDELFNSADRSGPDGAGGRKTVKLSEQITYIERSSTTSNLCFSSSSFSCASLEEGKPSLPTSAPPSLPPPPPPPPPPPLPPASLPLASPAAEGALSSTSKKRLTGEESFTGCKSTVNIQDYSSKHLQRVRYLSSPSPSRSSMMEQPLHAQTIHRWTDSGSDTDHETGLRRKANTVLPFNALHNAHGYVDKEDGIPASYSSKHPSGTNRKIHVGGAQDENEQQWANTPSATLKHPVEPEQLNEIAHCTVGEGYRRGSHNSKPADSHSERTGTIEIRSVLLPDYSEYYNEEGVIII